MTLPSAQRDVAAFLEHLTGAPPVETHISAVFRGRHEVLKLKKAVQLSFLDFSSLEARRDMARRELALNRVAAPGIYRGVQAVVRGADGRLRLAPETAAGAVDYVVRMARIADDAFLDVIARRGGLTPVLLDALGDAVAALHAALPPVVGWDSAGGLRGIIEGNGLAARQAGLPEAAVRVWQARALAALAHAAPVLAARAEAGCVRRAHGDLHLGNLCLWQGRPTAFDMLEFDDALATIDVGYDLAFLLMDLEFHGGRAAANRVMNRYLARTGDFSLLAGMPCFLAVRAMVRAHVQAARGEAGEAGRYLEVASRAFDPVAPVVVAVGGLQGTGKTTLARALAPALGRAPGAAVVRSDETRKRLFHRAPEERLPEAAYTHDANERVNAALLETGTVALRAGQAVVLDSTFLDAGLRAGAADAAGAAGAPFLGLWLEAPLDILLGRVRHRSGDASDAGEAVLRRAAAVDPGPMTWLRVRSDDAAAVLAAALVALEELPVGGRSAAPEDRRHVEAGEGVTFHGHDDERGDERGDGWGGGG